MSQSSRISVGNADVIALQDGATEFGKDVFPNTDPDKIDSILSSGGASAIETSFNAFVVRRGRTNVLVDCGCATCSARWQAVSRRPWRMSVFPPAMFRISS